MVKHFLLNYLLYWERNNLNLEKKKETKVAGLLILPNALNPISSPRLWQIHINIFFEG